MTGEFEEMAPCRSMDECYQVQRLQFERGRELFLRHLMDGLYEQSPDAVKQWIYDRWPRSIGLYD